MTKYTYTLTPAADGSPFVDTAPVTVVTPESGSVVFILTGTKTIGEREKVPSLVQMFYRYASTDPWNSVVMVPNDNLQSFPPTIQPGTEFFIRCYCQPGHHATLVMFV